MTARRHDPRPSDPTIRLVGPISDAMLAHPMFVRPSPPIRDLLARACLACLALLAAPHPASADPLGPSSRRTHWTFTEIMYHPVANPDGRNLEFVELRNAGLIAEDLGGHRLDGEIDAIIPTGTLVPAGGFVVLASDPAAVEAHYRIQGVLPAGPRRLDNRGGPLRLISPAGAVLLELRYSPRPPWPIAAAGFGHSLVLARPSYGERDPRAWTASRRVGGSPGQPEPDPDPDPDPATASASDSDSAAATAERYLRLEELSLDTDHGPNSFIEIRNTSTHAADLSGCRLTLDPAEPGFVFPAGTVLPPGGHAAWPTSITGLNAPETGGRIALLDPTGDRVIDAVAFGAANPGTSQGRSPEGHDGFVILDHPTPAAPNAPSRPPEVVITELMYHPIGGDDDDEFVEILNRGPSSVDLTGWRFVEGIDYRFPPGTRLASGERRVVARNAARLTARYPNLPAHLLSGDYSGRLADAGERIVLARPLASGRSDPADPNSYVVVDEVTYVDGGQWGQWSDGGGSSLERRDPRATAAFPGNWADSDEEGKAPWTTLETTGVLDLGVGQADRLQLLAQGAGRYLVDDVEVLGAGGRNLVANGTFDRGTSGWTAGGTESRSAWESSAGAASPGSFRVEAVARGDTGANRIQTPLNPIPAPGSTTTLRAKVRWMRGHPEFLLRLRGNYLEAAGPLNLPTQLGTPGQTNSREVPNAGPAIVHLQQSPILPTAGQAVRITARISDPDGIASATLRYRLDPSTATTDVPLRDDGTNGDEIAGDGVYTARLPGQPSGTLVAYYLEATDAAGTPASPLGTSVPAATHRYPDGAPTREALIRFGETQPAGSLGTYRLWITRTNFDRWANRSPLDNSPLDVTFVYNAERIVHGVGALYAGSPHLAPGYTTPSGALCGYVLQFPKDEPFLGANDVVLDWPGRDATAQQEPFAYWLARELGIPFNHRRFIRLHVNGVTETSRGSIYEDAQQVNGDLIDSWHPDAAGGHLHKIEQWFEFGDSLGSPTVIAPRLEQYFGADGNRKTARYRWSWLKRAVQGSANDFDPLFALADAANAANAADTANAPSTADTHAAPNADTYPDTLQALADMEEWMRVFAVENIVVNFDAWGYDIGKNMYAYAPPNGRWRLFMWDIDWVMLASAAAGYSPQSTLMYRGPARFSEANRDPVVGRMYREPAFQRAYWRAIEDAVNGPLRPERVAERTVAIHAALVAEKVTRSSGSPLETPTRLRQWLANRRTYLLQQLAEVAAPFFVEPSPSEIVGPARLTLRGTAPIAVRDLVIAGSPLAVRWPTVTNWTAEIDLAPGANRFEILGLDGRGQPVTEARATIEVRYLGPWEAPRILSLRYEPPGSLTLRCETVPGAVYLWQSTDTLPATSWRSVSPELQATGTELTFRETVTPASAPRFYRVRRVR